MLRVRHPRTGGTDYIVRIWGAACCAPAHLWEIVEGAATERSGAGFVDHLLPDAAGFEEDFDDFAGGAFAPVGGGDVVGHGF